MKKFMLFLLVAISAISLGFTIYYFSTDNEVIYINSSYLVVEKGDIIVADDLLKIEHKDDNTKLTFGVASENSGVLSFQSGDECFIADKGGEGQIVIKTTNRLYPRLVVNVLVCDGSTNFPYIISSETALKRIGNDSQNKYLSDKSYILGSNIELASNESGNWTPISNFSGTFDGNYYTISNINITDSTFALANEANSCGFISMIQSSGIVRNLKLSNFSLNLTSASTVSNIGSIAGKNLGKISACEVTGSMTVSATAEYAIGGITGENNKGLIDRCGYEGGIVLDGATASHIGGGIAGNNIDSQISESYFRTNVDKPLVIASAKFGGITGVNKGVEKLSYLYDNYCYLNTNNTQTQQNIATVYGLFSSNIDKGEEQENKNVIMGNYYGGTLDTDSFQAIVSDNPIYNNKFNGFIEKANWTNLDRFVNKIYETAHGQKEKAFWNFNYVWLMGRNYPVLNQNFSSGSVYSKDISNVIGNTNIYTAQELYDSLVNYPNGSFNIYGEIDGQDRVIDFAKVDWLWGDENHPIPETFGGVLTAKSSGAGVGPCIIKNLKIINTKDYSESPNVGLVGKLTNTAVISDLVFNEVSIASQYDEVLKDDKKVKNVGVIAGINEGGIISNVKLENIVFNVSADTLGAVVGSNNYNADAIENGNCIKNITVKNVLSTEKFSIQAGGVVGYNNAIITKDGTEYNDISMIKIYAKYSGGISGYNDINGKIEYTKAIDVTFEKNYFETSPLYDGTNKFLAFGGITGDNRGNISEVYASLTVSYGADDFISDEIKLVIGGISGQNLNKITKAETVNIEANIKGNFCCYAGGIVGANGGALDSEDEVDALKRAEISNSMVSKGNIITAYDIREQEYGDFSQCSVVGGIAGIDNRSLNPHYTITECVVNIDRIRGRYAGGVSGLECGKVIKVMVGSQDRSTNVQIEGVIVGGFSSTVTGSTIQEGEVIDSALVENCIVFADVNGVMDGDFKDLNTIEALSASARAAMTPILSDKAAIRSSYAVVNFKGKGGSFSTVGYLANNDENRIPELKNCIYQNKGGNDDEIVATQISKENLKGSGGTNYKDFITNIGGERPEGIWYYKLASDRYPELIGLNNKLPKAYVA